MKRFYLGLLCVVPLTLFAQTPPAGASAKPKQEKPAKGELVGHVSTFLADTFVLYTEALNFHWNVTGEQFLPLHAFFQKQYEALADSVDLLAEQVRILGAFPPSTLQEFIQASQLEEPTGRMVARQMLRKYLSDTENIAKRLPPVIAYATEMGQDAVADLLIAQLGFHQKAAWMIRSILEK